VTARKSLPVLEEEIEARARSTQAAHPFWPCKQGCDLCCRSLPHLPTIALVEWERLREAIEALADSTRADVVHRTRAAPETGPLTCPLLDSARGACLVYEARPVACRTYGFYAERDAGLHCERVTRALGEQQPTEPVIWGNGESVASAMRAHGEPVSLRVWMAELDY
jgi:Fe-S-cluster containining protein